MEKDITEILDSAVEHGRQRMGLSASLKPKQMEAVLSFLQGSDTFVNLPTGYGKSMIYQLAPFCVDFMRNSQPQTSQTSDTRPSTSVAIIVSPLIALMRDQVKALKERGIEAAYVGDIKDKPSEKLNLQEGKFSIVFASPETLLGPLGRSLLTSAPYQENLCGFFVDEGHCVAKWGMKSGKVDAFRKCYSTLAELRSLVSHKIPMMALTATASPDTQNVIETALGMSKVTRVGVSPERVNIKYSVMNIELKEAESQYGWLMDRIKQSGVATPKVIIFCQSHKQCRELHAAFDEHLSSKTIEHVAMFHGCTEDKRKEYILGEFTKSTGIIRVLIATVAFGMGVNVDCLHNVIHHGPSRDVDDYFQETGRVGRDGKQSYAILLTYPGCFSACRVVKRMKDYTKSESCRRELLLEYYGYQSQHNSQYAKHFCCDNCCKKCTCGGDSCEWEQKDWCTKQLDSLSSVKQTDSESVVAEVAARQVSEDQRHELQLNLLAYRDSLLQGQACLMYAGVDIASGISLDLIDMIIKDCHMILSLQQLVGKYPFFDRAQASHVWEIMSETLGNDAASSGLVHVTSTETDLSSSTSEDLSNEETDNDCLRSVFNVMSLSASDTTNSD